MSCGTNSFAQNLGAWEGTISRNPASCGSAMDMDSCTGCCDTAYTEPITATMSLTAATFTSAGATGSCGAAPSETFYFDGVYVQHGVLPL